MCEPRGCRCGRVETCERLNAPAALIRHRRMPHKPLALRLGWSRLLEAYSIDPRIGWCGTPDRVDAVPLGGGLTRSGSSTPPNPRPIRAEKRSQSSYRADEGVPP
eukprot:351979-Chlamydomonas_euryale.AAC.4